MNGLSALHQDKPLAHARLLSLFSPVLRARQVFKGRFRHASFPGWVTQLEPIAARIEEIKLPAGEKTFGAIIQPVDWNFSFLENLAGLHQRFRADGEGMVHVLVLGKGFVDVRRAFAEQDVVVANVEARHAGIAQPTERFEAEQVAVKLFGFIKAIHRNRPVRHTFDFK